MAVSPHEAVARSCAAKHRRPSRVELSPVDAFLRGITCASSWVDRLGGGQILLLFPHEIRSSATKNLPLMTTHYYRAARTTCVDLTAFSSISSSRPPADNPCCLGSFSFSSCPTWAQTCKMLTPVKLPPLPTKIDKAFTLAHMARHEMPKKQDISSSCMCERANKTLTLHFDLADSRPLSPSLVVTDC